MNTTFKRVLKNGAVRFGLIVLSVLVTLAILAPVLGTVDPAWLDAINMSQKPMTTADWTGPVKPFGSCVNAKHSHTAPRNGATN